MGDMRVECYAEYRANERPLRFSLRGRLFPKNRRRGRSLVFSGSDVFPRPHGRRKRITSSCATMKPRTLENGRFPVS